MTNTENWPSVAVIGAGAVGGYFGGMLARAGAPVTMIGRPAFVDAVNKNGLFLDTLHFKESVRVEASTELSAAAGADIVLFCVKTTDNAATARELAPLLSPGALVVSFQNGVDNVEQIRAAANLEALPAVVYIGVSVPEPGKIKHAGRGDLVFGPRSEKTERLAALFERAGVPCRISENMAGELWTKLLWNCALNAISALAREVRANRRQRRRAARGAIARGRILGGRGRCGHSLSGFARRGCRFRRACKIATQMSGALSSTAQDLLRGKRTEIDSLNGYISRRGAELGVPTPVNHALYTMIKLLEGR